MLAFDKLYVEICCFVLGFWWIFLGCFWLCYLTRRQTFTLLQQGLMCSTPFPGKKKKKHHHVLVALITKIRSFKQSQSLTSGRVRIQLSSSCCAVGGRLNTATVRERPLYLRPIISTNLLPNMLSLVTFIFFSSHFIGFFSSAWLNL